MFSDELETLIQISIADGVLTDQEKAVLIKKATEEGVDINQLDIYIQYLMSQKQSEENAANMERIRSSKVGTAKKCPHCGGLVPELVDVCPHCKGLIKAEADEELTEIINMFEDALIELKSGGDIARAKANVERYVRKAKLYYENNAKVQKLLAEIEIETEKAEKAAKTNARNEAVKGAAGSVFKNIVSFMKSHKIIAAIIVLAIIGGLFQLCTGGEKEAAKNLIKENTTKVETLLKNGDINGAAKVIEDLEKSSTIHKDYDVACLNVYKAMIDAGMWEDVTTLALKFKSKVKNTWEWDETSSYIFLKAEFEEANKDFSILENK